MANSVLYIQISVLGAAFSISVEHKKLVFDRVSGETTFATTWSSGSIGTHERGAGFILQSLARHLDRFLAAYLRVNEEDCGGGP